MTIDWLHFTPWSSLFGGILIGLAAALLISASGRVLGISGIVGGLLRLRQRDAGWRLAFVLGLLAAPAVWALFAQPVQPRIDATWGMLILGGLLVGVGTRCGSGCTSGHGVCGLAQGSPRSLAATLAFMATGVATVYVVRHVLA